MLHARKQQLENELRVRMLRIRDAELTLLVRNSRALSVQSAMLSGVAFEGLLYTKMHGFTSEKASTVTKFLYPVMLAALLGCSLLAVFQFNLIVMMGPGLALRGPDGSMRVAVEACSIEYRTACFFLFLAVTIFHITLVLFAWGDIEREPYAKWMITFGAIGNRNNDMMIIIIIIMITMMMMMMTVIRVPNRMSTLAIGNRNTLRGLERNKPYKMMILITLFESCVPNG
ncbi:hypothetical protein T492DRAFT_315908 [Pavlovales sp. CCMP2436]|nr:hypothetical protein T492DRAFT_315908 [Pavlovales sp. CCMP2436]